MHILLWQVGSIEAGPTWSDEEDEDDDMPLDDSFDDLSDEEQDIVDQGQGFYMNLPDYDHAVEQIRPKSSLDDQIIPSSHKRLSADASNDGKY